MQIYTHCCHTLTEKLGKQTSCSECSRFRSPRERGALRKTRCGILFEKHNYNRLQQKKKKKKLAREPLH